MSEPTLTTYKRADGELIWGEYSFVTETEFFDELDEPIEVTKEVWTRLWPAETVTFKPPWWDDLQADNAADAAAEVAE